MLLLIIILLLLVIGLLSAYILLYKKEIKDIAKKIQFIDNNDTNKKINIQINSKEIRELTNQLNTIISDYKAEKIKISKAQQGFKEEIINISHDLRTPLTSINGYLQMVESENTSEDKRKEYYVIIKRRVDSLMKLIDEFFEFTRIVSDEYPMLFEKINVCNIIAETVSLFYYDFKSKNNEPIIDMPPRPIYIYVDKGALKRIFQNLIQNYFNHGAGDLFITVKEDGGHVSISFKNYALGIDNETAKRVFQRFYTTDKSRNKKTTGLGLTIVKNLITKMNGEIEAYAEDSFLVVNITF